MIPFNLQSFMNFDFKIETALYNYLNRCLRYIWWVNIYKNIMF